MNIVESDTIAFLSTMEGWRNLWTRSTNGGHEVFHVQVTKSSPSLQFLSGHISEKTKPMASLPLTKQIELPQHSTENIYIS